MSSTTLLRAERSSKPGVSRARPPIIATGYGPVSLHVTSDIGSLATRWTALQSVAPCTAAQTYSYAEAWARLVLAPNGQTPVIAVGSDADGRDLFLWAFETGFKFGTKMLRWLGESQASYAMGLFAPDAAHRFSASDISVLLRHVAHRSGASAAFLCAQPYCWDGLDNPFAKLRHQAAPSNGFAVELGNFTELYQRRFSKSSRSKFLRKQRKLGEAGALLYGWAATKEERLAVLEALFTQKVRQLAELGVENPFDARVRSFHREMALLPDDDPARLRLGYFKVNGAVAATHSGSLCHGRLAICFSSLAAGEMQRQSPGALLLRHQIEEASAQGLAFYDLGAGAGPNKDEWCDVVQPLFDSFIAFKPQGLLLTMPYAAIARTKRAIKSNRHLWPLVQRWRQTILRKDIAPQD